MHSTHNSAHPAVGPNLFGHFDPVRVMVCGPALGFIEEPEGIRAFEYAVLVTSLFDETISAACHYRELQLTHIELLIGEINHGY